jgi:uncharacterized YceG family protein
MRILGVVLAALAVVSAAPAAQPVVLGIVFPEGWSARQMADRTAEVRRIAIDKRKVTPRLTGAAYARATATAQPPRGWARWMKRRSIEGFLFPARYEFLPTTTAREIVASQITTFNERWASVDARIARNPYEILTVASMVERETIAPEERKLVAAVIYNRLQRGMPLGIDATLRYGLGIQGTKPLTRAHLASDSPYNTRRFKGLPPTPIGNPGLASLRAAALPARRDYLYYVRKPDGVHHFFTADESEFCEKAKEFGYSC